MNAISKPRKKPNGINTAASVRIGLPTTGIFASAAMLSGINAKNKKMKRSPMNAPKTVFQRAVTNFAASPTEKK